MARSRKHFFTGKDFQAFDEPPLQILDCGFWILDCSTFKLQPAEI
jgi:hypothetical protein